MTNTEIAAIFEEMAQILEFQEANPFRVRAYRNAARTVQDYPEPLAAVVLDPAKKLTDLAGIGKDLAEKITTLIETGALPQHQELIAAAPKGLPALLRVPGLGPKKAAALFRELGISNLDDLKKACEEQRVRGLKGFGAKTEETLLKGLSIAEQADLRKLWYEADDIVQTLLAHFKTCPTLERIEVAGSYRRGKETVGDLDLLVISTDVAAVMEHFAKFPDLADTIGRGETKMSIRLKKGMQVDLRVLPEESFGAALQYFTGSQQHNVILRGMAKERGLKINEYGVWRGEERVGGRTEEEVYGILDMPVFPPEIREARREFEWAAAGELPKLIELADLVGDLHMHTTATDGKATLEEMVAGAKARGYQYIAITDHSKRVSMANGLNAERLRQQWAEIDAFNAKSSGITVLKGIECDILEAGGMDLDDDVLAEADWVIASVHYGQQQTREQITKRIIDAIKHPSVSIIAHPTGRLINHRESYAVDLAAVIKAAADYGKFLELNASPERLDLDDVACASAKQNKVPIVISSDAHSVDGLRVLKYGVVQARRAGLTAADVANTRSWKQIRKLLGK